MLFGGVDVLILDSTTTKYSGDVNAELTEYYEIVKSSFLNMTQR